MRFVLKLHILKCYEMICQKCPSVPDDEAHRVKKQSLQGFPALESAADNRFTTNSHRNPKRFEAEWIAGAFDRTLARSKREHFLKISSRVFSLFYGFCVAFKKPGESRGIFQFPLRAISYQISGGFDQTGVCVRTQLADIGKLFILTTLKPFGNIAFRMLYFLKRVSREQA